MIEVEHSGRKWVSTALGPNGRPIWSIEEYIARKNYSHLENERLRRLNPNGKEEGMNPRWRDNDPAF
jgi:hypothetical protein